jgi:hypothetical protein
VSRTNSVASRASLLSGIIAPELEIVFVAAHPLRRLLIRTPYLDQIAACARCPSVTATNAHVSVVWPYLKAL